MNDLPPLLITSKNSPKNITYLQGEREGGKTEIKGMLKYYLFCITTYFHIFVERV